MCSWVDLPERRLIDISFRSEDTLYSFLHEWRFGHRGVWKYQTQSTVWNHTVILECWHFFELLWNNSSWRVTSSSDQFFLRKGVVEHPKWIASDNPKCVNQTCWLESSSCIAERVSCEQSLWQQDFRSEHPESPTQSCWGKHTCASKPCACGRWPNSLWNRFFEIRGCTLSNLSEHPQPCSVHRWMLQQPWWTLSVLDLSCRIRHADLGTRCVQWQ